ncbi:ribosome small subunit-dependent GTPase A [Erythrobacter sp. KY5]|uniref:ribosome small subunit-dependent GTPase A n=1 Tax=Erythrobacter sp. KY5 TaxID=2011159 RepID=UPI000DBF2775|nr:ribosome small subunit-dependent GTPase A [Erythrobacter sp. KY5]AWW74055.1 ribosome small subunit-dependent GTPase A [Erythrobacter sp. KY5]
MTKDFSVFRPSKALGGRDQRQPTPLETLGWQPFFSRQVSADELSETPPVRIVEVHRGAMHVVGDGIDRAIVPIDGVAIGDWIMLNPQRPGASRILARKSLIKRRAPGTDRHVQLIAANIDTIFIVSSCNQDFNVARLERYIAIAFEADIAPVILLTKSDLAQGVEEYLAKAQAISDLVPVIALDARGDEPGTKLGPWCKPGQTVAFLGSSGVGKSTLTNALAGSDAIATQPIREDDAKGRHTTTRRQLHLIPGGCVVLDTPGMRELQLTDAASGIDSVFADLHELASQCRFKDCRHEAEPGCAILDAIEHGAIDEARLNRWRKLKAEEAFNNASLAERRSRDKEFGKIVRRIKQAKFDEGGAS